MKQCVVKVQSQHHLDDIIGRVSSLGGTHDYWWGNSNMYAIYNKWTKFYHVYIWLRIDKKGKLIAQMHNHTCNCKVFETVQDAVEYLGFNAK